MDFRLKGIPAQVAVGSLLIYALTLSWGVTLNSLALTAKVAGWDWQPMATQPVLWLLTLPLRLLPAAWVPMSLNFLSAVCAAATLGILVRSLELLPWLRPLETLSGWKRRLPMLLAVGVCGLEFSFWQEATATTGEMLDVLLLAAGLWGLLEYRASKDKRWLQAAALVWGLGMTENWVMMLTLPLFVGGVLWLGRRRCLKPDFLLPIAGFGLAGLSAYALLPLINGLLPGSPWSFEDAWIHSLRQTRMWLGICSQFWLHHRLIALAALFFYLLPVLAGLLQLKDEETKNKVALSRFQIWTYRGLRVGLLLICAWLAFDPLFGPRHILGRFMSVAPSLLSFDYLNGLSIGFLAGNVLWSSRQDLPERRPRRHRRFAHNLARWLRQLPTAAVTALGILVVLGLVIRHAPRVLLANRQPLTQFGELAWRSLPPGGGILLSDNPEMLKVFQAAQSWHTARPGWVAMDIRALPIPEYRAQLERLRPGLWPAATHRLGLKPRELVELLDGLVRTQQVFYVHPSFGHLFELFYQQPVGAIYELKRFQSDWFKANSFSPPALSTNAVAQNEKLWDDFNPQIESLRRAGSTAGLGRVSALEKRLWLGAVGTNQIQRLAEWYSAALNGWGVALQRNGYLPAAQRRFTQALALNANNWLAQRNLECNTNLQAGTKMTLAGSENVASQIGGLQQQEIVINGLALDGPVTCYLLGGLCERERLPRLAMQYYDRARALLAPEVLEPQFALIGLYAGFGRADQAHQTINRLRTEVKKLPDYRSLDAKLSLLEAQVWFSQTNLANARQELQDLRRRYPEDARTLIQIAQVFLTFKDFDNAESVLAAVLAREPDNLPALRAKSGILLQSGRPSAAIPVLNQLLSVTNSPEARLMRGIAFLQASNYPAAQADFLAPQDSTNNRYVADSGLAEIALLQQDTNKAILYYQRCLSNAPPESQDWRDIRARLDLLVPPVRKP